MSGKQRHRDSEKHEEERVAYDGLVREDCPCPRTGCKRHSLCDLCRQHHSHPIKPHDLSRTPYSHPIKPNDLSGTPYSHPIKPHDLSGTPYKKRPPYCERGGRK